MLLVIQMVKMKGRRKSIIHWQAVTSAISTTMVLVLLGVLVLFVLTARELRDSVREDLTMTVVLDEGSTSQMGHAVESSLATQPFVRDITYISSEQALKEQSQALGLDPSEFLGENPFPISMDIHLKANYACTDSMKWISRQIRKDRRITEVIYQRDIMESLNSNLHHISIVLLVVTALLAIVSLSLINNTVRMSVHSRRFIINTMKLVGARWGFIRRPFLIRSLWIGVISAVVADAVLVGGIQWLFQYNSEIQQYVPMQNIGIMAGVVLVFGLVITLLCTFISVTHFLRLRESDLYK